MEEVTTETSTEQAHRQRQPIGEWEVSKGMGVGKPGTSWESQNGLKGELTPEITGKSLDGCFYFFTVHTA